jgi:hypothetical protein
LNDPNKEYEGIYKHGYMTPFDQQVADEAARRQKNIGGMFKRYSGVASAIPLRKEGVVRSQGPYHNRPEEVMYNKEKPTLLEGPWRPGAAVMSDVFSPIKVKKTQSYLPPIAPEGTHARKGSKRPMPTKLSFRE